MLHGFRKMLWGLAIPAAVLLSAASGTSALHADDKAPVKDRRYMKIPYTPKHKLDGKKKIPLRIPTLPMANDTSVDGQVRQAQFQAFKKKFPYIEVSGFSGISIPGMGQESKLMLAIAGGMAPDVIQVNFRMSDTYIHQGFIYPLDSYLNRDYPGGCKQFIDDMVKPIRPVAYREGPKVDDFKAGQHLWFMPGALSVRVLAWRKDFFQEAGLDPERPPRDWNELYEYAKKLSDPATRRYGLQMGSGKMASWDFVGYIWSAGGDVIAKDEKGNWIAAYGTREAAEALDFYIKLATEPWYDSDQKLQKGYTTRSDSDQKNSGQVNKIAINSPYLDQKSMGSQNIDPSLTGIAAFPPKERNGKGRTELNAIMQGIFAHIEGRYNSDDVWVSAEEIREAAWLWISYNASDEAKQLAADVMVNAGAGNTLSPEWCRKYGYEEYLKFFPENFEKVYNEAVENGVPEPYGKNCQLVYLRLTQPIDEALQLARDGKLPADREERLKLLQSILKKSADDTTVQMIGYLTPEERERRNNWAVVAAIIILSIFSFALYKIWIIFSPKDLVSGKSRGWEFSKKWGAYLIMLPALISILLWVYTPMISGSKILFQDFRFAGHSEWVGLNNLADVLFSRDWWAAIWNTIRYMCLILGLGFVAPIILAILLQEVSRCKVLYRTLFYLPAVMSGLVVIYMWRLFYGAGPTGILNQVIQSIYDGINFVLVPIVSLFNEGYQGLEFQPIAWLEDSKWAMLACILPSIWASAGPGCLIYLAALKGVPDDVYEAAEIDGANFFMKIWHVTLPTLKALIIINFVGAFIAAAQSGGQIMVMTFGGADTEVAELHIFKEAYTNLRFGTAIAMAWFLGAFTLVFTIYNLKKLSNMEFKTTGK
ncbi:MAG: extracellular solute-binding protein [Lentisphaeria bacterium]|nr:extracellular solute-binding protein [Lentisphaeria bacterium]